MKFNLFFKNTRPAGWTPWSAIGSSSELLRPGSYERWESTVRLLPSGPDPVPVIKATELPSGSPENHFQPRRTLLHRRSLDRWCTGCAAPACRPAVDRSAACIKQEGGPSSPTKPGELREGYPLYIVFGALCNRRKKIQIMVKTS